MDGATYHRVLASIQNVIGGNSVGPACPGGQIPSLAPSGTRDLLVNRRNHIIRVLSRHRIVHAGKRAVDLIQEWVVMANLLVESG
jgi:hypothetical protein